MTNFPFDPSIHLGVSDVQADTLEDHVFPNSHQLLEDGPLPC